VEALYKSTTFTFLPTYLDVGVADPPQMGVMPDLIVVVQSAQAYQYYSDPLESRDPCIPPFMVTQVIESDKD